jgi:hypothetical protein
MTALLDHCWKEPREQYDGYNQRLAVSLEAEPIVNYSRNGHGKPTRITGTAAQTVIEIAQSIYQDCGLALQGTSVSVYLTGETLEFPEDLTESPNEAAEERRRDDSLGFGPHSPAHRRFRPR